jgi:riboflavin kinase/FMN adenylyltransferase
MQVHRQIERLASFRKAVVTIGTFDGVHTGHQKIIEQLKQEARQIKGESVLITFDPHPRKILSPDKPLKLITTLDEKIELLDKQGIDHLVIVPFTTQFASLSAEAYIQDFLVNKFHPDTVIIGYDHRFGHDRMGDFHMMEAFAEKLNFELREIPEHIVDSIIVSSTKIRQAITKGEIEIANDLLGYDFFFQGIIVEGNKLGRKLGFPTANLEIKNPDKLIPGNGVYAVSAALNGEPYEGMMNIGIRPTLNDGLFMIEVNLFNFDEEVYGSELRVYVKKFMRPEMKFNGLDALKEQITNDKKEVLAILSSKKLDTRSREKGRKSKEE